MIVAFCHGAPRAWRTGSGRVEKSVTGVQKNRRQMLRDALHHLSLALDLLDRAAAPPQIGAHVDLALNELAGLQPGMPASRRAEPAGEGVTHH